MTAPPESVQRVLDICQQAAQANHDTSSRQGRLIVLGPDVADELMITADLHGNRLNFQHVVRIADLDHHPRRHLVLQEVCHGGPQYPTGGGCMSHLLLEDVMSLKAMYPHRVHFLLSNHELAEITDLPIAKAGKMLNLQFRAGMNEIYGSAAKEVRHGYLDFLKSCPLAIRTTNGAFACHGSPSRVVEDGFDASVFDREPIPADFQAGGLVYRLVWGRDFRPENAEAFADRVGASLLIHGHEPCAEGYHAPNPRQVILDCCGRNACYLILPLNAPLTHEEVVSRIRRLNGFEHVKS